MVDRSELELLLRLAEERGADAALAEHDRREEEQVESWFAADGNISE